MPSVTLSADSTIGLIAGWGRFPISVAQKLRAQGHDVVCVAIRGHASTELESICTDTFWSGVGRFGAHVRFFRRHGVSDVTMAGKLFKHEILYSGSLLWRHRPDWTCLKTFGPSLLGRQRDARDDSLLMSVIRTYDQHDMTVRSATELVPELLVTDGVWTHRDVTVAQRHDIDVGWKVAKAMGGLDVGQAVAVKDGTVIAVEAIEGTDACVERAGLLCRRGGWTLVKVSKPKQDMRFDVPTIGTQTVQNVANAGGRAIVVEADRTILLDADATIALADRLGVAIVAMNQASADSAGVTSTLQAA